MPIGEFGGAAALPGDGSPFFSAPMYWFYEMGHAALTPARAFADAGRMFYKNPANPFAHTSPARRRAAAFELFERTSGAKASLNGHRVGHVGGGTSP